MGRVGGQGGLALGGGVKGGMFHCPDAALSRPPSAASFSFRCAYQLQDVRRLAVCRERLDKADQHLRRAYGAGSARARQLHGEQFCPEAAV
jgi:hypothetical protein